MEQVQHYASVDARERLEPGIAGEMNKPICSVDRAPLSSFATDFTPMSLGAESLFILLWRFHAFFVVTFITCGVCFLVKEVN